VVFRPVCCGGGPQVFPSSEFVDGGAGYEIVEIVSGPEGAIVLLLIMVGVESSLDEMFKVGLRAAMVAALATIVPFCRGLLVTV
jgi:hypothetical protein